MVVLPKIRTFWIKQQWLRDRNEYHELILGDMIDVNNAVDQFDYTLHIIIF